MVAWEKASPEVVSEYAPFLDGFDCMIRPMFGCTVYFKNGNMFTGVKGHEIFLRLSKVDQKLIMDESDEVQPFEPKPAFFMKEYVAVPVTKIGDRDFIMKWLNRSYQYVSALPPKNSVKRKRSD
jgi:TfoX/Sxy family transcriptional regulator of competence genes